VDSGHLEMRQQPQQAGGPRQHNVDLRQKCGSKFAAIADVLVPSTR